MKWHKMYFSGSTTKRDGTDKLHYYFNDAGYKIHPIYDDWRHSKIICYNITAPNGAISVGYKTLGEAKHKVFLIMEGRSCL